MKTTGNEYSTGKHVAVSRNGSNRPIQREISDGSVVVETAQPVARPVLIPRDQFLHEHFEYKPGEHITFLGPTQSGKTTLAFQLLQVSTHYKVLPGLVVVMKPRDPVVQDWAKKLDYRIIRDWPPPVHLRGRERWEKPNGYMVWPKHSFEPDEDDEHLGKVFHRALISAYRKGDTALFADEVYGLANELHYATVRGKRITLERDLKAIWTRGASMGCGLWAASQRPYDVPQLAYNSAEHLFLANDPDKRSRDRFGEIGGIDPDILKAEVVKLPKYHWLYIRRTGPAMCIVGK